MPRDTAALLDLDAPDLSYPSAAGLAWLLRHPERWPAEFGPWDYEIPGHCACGLTDLVWPAHDGEREFGFPREKMTRILYFLADHLPDHSMGMITPTDVAAALEALIAEQVYTEQFLG